MRFLLVHGTTQSPDGWRLLIDELDALGHSAVTTDLARFGERLSATEYGDAVAEELSGSRVDVVVAHSGAGLLLPAIAFGVDPTGDHDAARRFLFHDCSPGVAEWALTTLRLFVPASVYSEQVPLAPAIPALSVVPDSDRTLRTEWMIAASREGLGIEPSIVPGGHCPHVSRPREVATILSSVLGDQ